MVIFSKFYKLFTFKLFGIFTNIAEKSVIFKKKKSMALQFVTVITKSPNSCRLFCSSQQIKKF